MSDKLPPIETFDLQDPKIKAAITRLGAFFNNAGFIIVGYEAAIALSYGPPDYEIPSLISWGSGYPCYEAVLILAKQYAVPVHWDDEIAEKLIKFYRARNGGDLLAPQDYFPEIARIIVTLGIIRPPKATE
jgi:type III secretion system FlhB-like substrate exporter